MLFKCIIVMSLLLLTSCQSPQSETDSRSALHIDEQLGLLGPAPESKEEAILNGRKAAERHHKYTDLRRSIVEQTGRT